MYPRDIPVEFTYAVFATVAAIISFAVVKIHVKFSHCFHVYTSIDIEDLETQNEVNGNSPDRSSTKMKLRKILRGMMYLNFITPLFVIIMFIDPLARKYIVPNFLSEEVFAAQRLFLVFIACLIRAFTFREELQFCFNESYKWIKHVAANKDERLFKYAQYRI